MNFEIFFICFANDQFTFSICFINELLNFSNLNKANLFL